MTTAAQIAGSNSIIAPMLKLPRPVFGVQHEINRADLAEVEQEELLSCARHAAGKQNHALLSAALLSIDHKTLSPYYCSSAPTHILTSLPAHCSCSLPALTSPLFC
jgi:hypothetical protein